MDARRMRPKQKPKIPPMDQRIKPNPKYENVRPTINTGNNLRKQMEKMQEVSQFYRFRPDEIFRRITVTSMVQLMLEQSKLEIQEDDQARGVPLSPDSGALSPPSGGGDAAGAESGEDSAVEADMDNKTVVNEDDEEMIESVVFKGKMIKRNASIQSHSKSVANLIQGVGDADDGEYGFRKVSNSSQGSSGYHHHDSSMAASTFNIPDRDPHVLAMKEPIHRSVSEGHLLKSDMPQGHAEDEGVREKKETPYLILDIRSPEEYDSAHVVGARNYHHIRISRACNFETKDMLTYKNKQGKLIVVYDYDESVASRFCTTLIERGYENVFMLSGGLRVAYMKFPTRLVTKADSADYATFNESDIAILEEFMEEALNSGTSRLSGYAPSLAGSSRVAGTSSRASSQHGNSRSTTAGSRSVSPQKRNRQAFQPSINKSPVKAQSHRR